MKNQLSDVMTNVPVLVLAMVVGLVQAPVSLYPVSLQSRDRSESWFLSLGSLGSFSPLKFYTLSD